MKKLNINENPKKEIENSNESADVDINDGNIDRIVPLSTAELMGVSYQKNDKSIIVEFGYIKNHDKEEVVIDTRKKLPYPMAIDLYKKLKKYFESEKK